MFCQKCGNKIEDEAIICPHCGCATGNITETDEKKWLPTYLLCWFLGIFGAHRFYTGYKGIGIVQLLTLGGCGIWVVIDLISLSFNKYKLEDGNELGGYIRSLGIVCFIYLIVVIIAGIRLMISD